MVNYWENEDYEENENYCMKEDMSFLRALEYYLDRFRIENSQEDIRHWTITVLG